MPCTDVVGMCTSVNTAGPELNLTYNLIDDVIITFVLNCTSVGIPVSQMKWLVNGSSIEDSDPFPILADAVEGYYFSILSRETEGDYSCVVTNGLDASYTANRSISSIYINLISITLPPCALPFSLSL